MRPVLRQVLLHIAASVSDWEGARGMRAYPDGTAREGSQRTAERLTERRQRREAERRLSWSDLLLEAVAVAVTAEPDSAALEAGLVRVSTLSAAWLENIRNRRIEREQANGPPPPGTVLHVRLPPRSLVYRAQVRRDGQVHIPALGRTLSLDEVMIQRHEPDDPPPAPTDTPLREQIHRQLDGMRQRTQDSSD